PGSLGSWYFADPDFGRGWHAGWPANGAGSRRHGVFRRLRARASTTTLCSTAGSAAWIGQRGSPRGGDNGQRHLELIAACTGGLASVWISTALRTPYGSDCMNSLHGGPGSCNRSFTDPDEYQS